MALPRSYFERQLANALRKSVPIAEAPAAAASLAPPANADKDLTTIDGHSAIENLTNIITAHAVYNESTSAAHRAGDALQQTSHLLLEAGNLNKSYDHIQNAMRAHKAAHDNFKKVMTAHKAAHATMCESVAKHAKSLAKVLGGGPDSTFASEVTSEPNRLDTAKAAAINQLCKALRQAGVNVSNRVNPNAGIPSRFGKNWTDGRADSFSKADRDRVDNQRGTNR